MARIRSGILGNIRGKVAGVVGSQWKNINYLREYVKPANPDTDAQRTQRGKMTDVVEFCKPIVGPIFNAYTDKFLKGMSGYNFFVKRNIAEFDGTPDYEAVKLTEGKLSPLAALACTYDTANGNLSMVWEKNLGNNGKDDDEVYWLIYDKTSGLWYYCDAVVARDDVSDTQTIVDGLTATDLTIYAVVAQYTGTILTMIGNNEFYTVQAA